MADAQNQTSPGVRGWAERWLSADRLAPYLAACGGGRLRARPRALRVEHIPWAGAYVRREPREPQSNRCVNETLHVDSDSSGGTSAKSADELAREIIAGGALARRAGARSGASTPSCKVGEPAVLVGGFRHVGNVRGRVPRQRSARGRWRPEGWVAELLQGYLRNQRVPHFRHMSSRRRLPRRAAPAAAPKTP